MGIPSAEYNRYLADIKAANSAGDKESLRQIQKLLIANYGPTDRDVEWLLRQFRYNV